MSALIPPCAGLWWLFDSTNPADHLEARALCADCPMRAECQDIASRYQRGPYGLAALQGTWAGRLYGPTLRGRLAAEDDLFTDDDARAAHRAWQRADPADRTRSGVGDRVVIGERVYQRRSQRRRKGRAA